MGFLVLRKIYPMMYQANQELLPAHAESLSRTALRS